MASSPQIKPEAIIHRVGQGLLRPEIPFRRQNGSMPKQQLDLFQVSTSLPAELRAGSPEIVRSQLSQLRLPGVANHQPPDRFLVLYAAAQHQAGLGHRTEEPAFADPCGRSPEIDASLDSSGDGHGSDVIPFSKQIRDDPAGVSLLQMINLESKQFRPPQATTDEQGQDGSIPPADDYSNSGR